MPGQKAAIVGFGGMGQRHYQACKKADVDVVAIAEFLPEKVKTVLPDFPAKNIYRNVVELLRDHHVDIISIASNSPYHAEGVIESARGGIKNILCEKPMATKITEANEMLAACGENNSRLAVNHISRWSENSHSLKKMIEQGAIGQPRHIRFVCGSVGLGNQGTHAFDKMRYYLGSEPAWIAGQIDKTGTPNVRGAQFKDPAGFGMILFENGARGFIDTSEDTGIPYFLELVGQYGHAVVNEYHDQWSLFARTEEDRKAPLTRYIMPLVDLNFRISSKFDIVELTSKAILELLSGGSISCSGEDGLKALEMVIALHVSDHENNRKISLPIQEEYWQYQVNFA